MPSNPYKLTLPVTVSSLDRLLRLRSKLRADGPTSKRSPYTCIDYVLAKLGVLVLLVVGDLDLQKDYAVQGGTLESQMERDAILAAGQLPGECMTLSRPLPVSLTPHCRLLEHIPFRSPIAPPFPGRKKAHSQSSLRGFSRAA